MLHSPAFWQRCVLISLPLLVGCVGCRDEPPVERGPRTSDFESHHDDQSPEALRTDLDADAETTRQYVEKLKSLNELGKELTAGRASDKWLSHLKILKEIAAAMEAADSTVSMDSMESEYIADLAGWFEQLPERVKSQLPPDTLLAGSGWIFKFHLQSPGDSGDTDAIPKPLQRLVLKLGAPDDAQPKLLQYPVVSKLTSDDDQTTFVLQCVVKEASKTSGPDAGQIHDPEVD